MMKKISLILILVVLLAACGSTTTTYKAPAKSKCETVDYEVAETWDSKRPVNGVSITLHNATGDTEQGDYKVPFRARFQMCGGRNFKYISAQIILPTSNAGKIQCKITVDGVIVSTAIASGFPSIAGCSD
jgi:hypothetical protein